MKIGVSYVIYNNRCVFLYYTAWLGLRLVIKLHRAAFVSNEQGLCMS